MSVQTATLPAAMPTLSGPSLAARLMASLGKAAGLIAAFCVFAFIAGPLIVTIGASFSPKDYIEFPPSGFSMRWYQELLSNPTWLQSFRLSLTTTLISVPISLGLGILAAYALGRGTFRGREAIESIFLSPIVLPEVMIGTALLYFLAGIGLAGSLTALVIAHVLITLPYVVRLVLVSVQSIDRNLEMAASVLGASPRRVFITVTAPLMAPGLFAATIFSIVLSIGELGVTVFVAGAETTTLPLQIYSRVLFGVDPTITAVSALLTFITFPALVLLDRLVGLDRVF